MGGCLLLIFAIIVASTLIGMLGPLGALAFVVIVLLVLAVVGGARG